MIFQPVTCNMMQLTRKQTKTINAEYSLEGAILQNVDKIIYLGVIITEGLRLDTHVSNICTKANRTLGFLRRNLYPCPQDVKKAAYKGLVRPVLEYGYFVWDPQSVVLQGELESVQKRPVRLVTGNYNYETWSMPDILGHLKRISLKIRRKDNRLILLYKDLKGKTSLLTDGVEEITTRWHFRLLQLAQILINAASFHRLLGIGTPFQISAISLLKMQMIVLLILFLW